MSMITVCLPSSKSSPLRSPLAKTGTSDDSLRHLSHFSFSSPPLLPPLPPRPRQLTLTTSNLTPPPRARPDRAPRSTRNPRLRRLASTRLQSHARRTRSATQHGPSAHPLLFSSTQDLTLMRVSLRACRSRAMRYTTTLPSRLSARRCSRLARRSGAALSICS
jgi:hypothetical protein